jgi:hypothetical protein
MQLIRVGALARRHFPHATISSGENLRVSASGGGAESSGRCGSLSLGTGLSSSRRGTLAAVSAAAASDKDCLGPPLQYNP